MASQQAREVPGGTKAVMHFLKASFVTAVFFGGLILGKDLAISVLARASASSAGSRAVAA